MIRQINRSEFSDALRQGLDTDGPLNMMFSEDVQPTIQLYDSQDSPYHRFGQLVKRVMTSTTPGAGNFAYVWVSPQRGLALQILGYRLANNSGASRTFNEKLYTQANIAAVGADVTDTLAYVSGQAAGVRSPCSINAGEVNTDQGTALDSFTLADATNTGLVLFPKPGIVLFGNDSGGIPGWGFRLATVAVGTFQLSVIGREWPLTIAA